MPFLLSLRKRTKHLTSLLRRRRLLTSRRSNPSWQTCVLHSMQRNRMAATSEMNAVVSSAEELQALLTAHCYVTKPAVAKVLYLALRLEKPLLLEGPPGAGKTQIAKVLSEALGMDLIRLQCYEGIDESKALYQWNEPLQRMALEFVHRNSTTQCQEEWSKLKRRLYSTD